MDIDSLVLDSPDGSAPPRHEADKAAALEAEELDAEFEAGEFDGQGSSAEVCDSYSACVYRSVSILRILCFLCGGH